MPTKPSLMADEMKVNSDQTMNIRYKSTELLPVCLRLQYYHCTTEDDSGVDRVKKARGGGSSAQLEPPQKMAKPYQGPDCQVYLTLGKARASVEGGGQTRGQFIHEPSHQISSQDSSDTRIQSRIKLTQRCVLQLF